MGVWGAIANKIEASQETCFLGAKITQAFLQIIKWYVPKKKAHMLPYLIFLKLMYRNWEEITLIYGGLG